MDVAYCLTTAEFARPVYKATLLFIKTPINKVLQARKIAAMVMQSHQVGHSSAVCEQERAAMDPGLHMLNWWIWPIARNSLLSHSGI